MDDVEVESMLGVGTKGKNEKKNKEPWKSSRGNCFDKGRWIVYEQDMKIIESAQNGNKEDMTKLIEDNNRLIWSIVRRFNGRGYDTEDLYQIGSIGFIKAIQRFGHKFLKFDFQHMQYHTF